VAISKSRLTSKKGFTVVETMLVLAVTGALVAGVLFGVGASVNAQRYSDAATSLKSFLQNQYNELSNTRNERDDGTQTCDKASAQVSNAGTTGQKRGQSDCVIMGRYISIVDGTLTTVSVNGGETNVAVTDSTDTALFTQRYVLGISPGTKQESSMEWGTTAASRTIISPTQVTDKTNAIGILLLRSPVSGTMYTFVTEGPHSIDDLSAADLRGMVTTTAMKSRVICVESDGLAATSFLSVIIGENANGPTAIESSSNDLLKSNPLVPADFAC